METTEEFWKGEFGDAYAMRNLATSDERRATAVYFARALRRATPPLANVIELGAGTGRNLEALRHLLPHALLTGVEINHSAYKMMRDFAHRGFNESVLDLEPLDLYDLVITKGLLIHIPPDDLPRAYKLIHDLCQRWVLLAEYYSPRHEEILYRGHQGRLWRGDFAGDLMTRYPALSLVDYGFIYHKDPCPQDDLTWFLLKKAPA